MWKRLCLILMAIALLALIPEAFAATSEEIVEGMQQKFVRGVVNTFTGWMELPHQIIKGWDEGFVFLGDENNKVVGALVGVLEGVGHAVGRTASGVTEIVGFWAANPADNEGIGTPLDAEKAWEKGESYDYLNPSFIEAACVPKRDKLLRGLGNAVLGVVEIPGQMMKGTTDKAPDFGLIKGVWYAFSRTLHGVSDVATFLVPNPTDQKGVAFEQQWPWTAFIEQTSGSGQ